MPLITKHNLLVEAEKFRSSAAFLAYVAKWSLRSGAVERVLLDSPLDINKPLNTFDDAKSFCAFCESLWTALSENPSIRTSVFFTVRDFADYHCYGDYYEEEAGDEDDKAPTEKFVDLLSQDKEPEHK